MTRLRIALPLALTLATLVVACERTTEPGPAVTLKVSTDSLALFEFDTARLVATLHDANGRALSGQPTVWISLDTTIVQVRSNGTVRALQLGRTGIAALSDGFRTVIPAQVEARYLDIHIGMDLGVVCGLSDRGRVYCPPGPIPRPIHLAPPFTAMSSGSQMGCGLATDSTAYCWTFPSDTATRVSAAARFARVAVGYAHVCALTAVGAAYCWGANGSGQLGNGDSTRADAAAPVPVAGGHQFSHIGGGADFTCALASTGDVWCWGANAYGQLGTGAAESTLYRALTPLRTVLPEQAVQVAVGLHHACAIGRSGTGYCWGEDGYGALGVPTGYCQWRWPCSPTPVIVGGGQLPWQFQSLSAGGYHTCGLAGGVGYCWGWNRSGQLGDGTTTDAYAPVRVIVAEQPRVLQGGAEASCAISQTGTASCWGLGYGQSPVRFPFQP